MADGWLDIFRFGFMQRALIAGLIIGAVCGLLGVFVVLRRTAPLGDALAHVSFGGVALGVAFGFLPLYVAVVVAVGGGGAVRVLPGRRGFAGRSPPLLHGGRLRGGGGAG